MAKGKQVEALTRRSLARGRARSGPWEVVTTAGHRSSLYHYGHRVAYVDDARRVQVSPREGHGISVSDGDGINAFARALDLSAPSFKRNPRAYSGGQVYPRRGGPEAEEMNREAERRGDRLRAAGTRFYPTTGLYARSHAQAHANPSHHVGPCDEACRRGYTQHVHRVRRSR